MDKGEEGCPGSNVFTNFLYISHKETQKHMDGQPNTESLQRLITSLCIINRQWCGGAIGRASSRVWVLPRHHCTVAFGNLHLCASVTKQYNFVPVRGRLPFNWGSTDKVWSMCSWQVKLWSPCYTQAMSDFICYCTPWQPVGWAVCLNWNKAAYYYFFFAHWYFIPRGLEINKV